jgi:hypothetical protein
MTPLEQYKVCQERGHTRSVEREADDAGPWDICKFCKTKYRTVTKTVLEEKDIPNG